MKFENGYKLIYAKVEDGKNVLYAAKDMIPSEDDVEITLAGKTDGMKLFYVKDGAFYGSTKNIPTEDDAAIVILAGEDVVIGVDPTSEGDDNGEDPAPTNDEGDGETTDAGVGEGEDIGD